MNGADILWNDQSVYQARYEKTASALIAISQALERNRPLGGGEAEFLELYSRTVAADPEAFTAVWRDPTAYFWVRLAYEFVGNCLAPATLSPLAESAARERHAADPKSALKAHLNDFKRFVLALGVIAGLDQKFVTPLQVSLPFAIPSSRLVISGAGVLQIDALIDGHLEVTRAGTKLKLPLVACSIESLTVRESPVAIAQNYELLLQPEAFNLPGLNEGAPLRLLPLSFQAEHATLTGQALELIHRHCPETFEHFRQVVRLIALKPSELGEYSNISHSDLPGSFAISVANDPYLMADFFIHEFHHNRFFFVEERGAFFALDRDNQATGEAYYSPFRDDLRPLHGIFHGLYVYIAVWRFWFAVYRSGETSGLRLDQVRDQVAFISIQLAIAVSQLRRFAHFSPLGILLFEELTGEATRIQKTTRALDFPSDLPAIRCSDEGILSVRCDPDTHLPLTVSEMILGHAQRCDRRHQCQDLDSIIEASLASR